MAHCDDCGTRLERAGICPNCHEELFIATGQAEYLDWPLSDEFTRLVEEQSEQVRQRRAAYSHVAQEKP